MFFYLKQNKRDPLTIWVKRSNLCNFDLVLKLVKAVVLSPELVDVLLVLPCHLCFRSSTLLHLGFNSRETQKTFMLFTSTIVVVIICFILFFYCYVERDRIALQNMTESTRGKQNRWRMYWKWGDLNSSCTDMLVLKVE